MEGKTEETFLALKLDYQKQEKIRYHGTLLKRMAYGLVIQAEWTLANYDLGYVCIEPGDLFVEYYYTDRWFNIFVIYNKDRKHKGWYCNIAEPAQIGEGRIEQVDLLLDVWVDPSGEALILDEDEFAAADLSKQQRKGAEQGLRDLLKMLEAREEVFSRP